MNQIGTRRSYSGEPKATRVDRAAARVEQLKKEMAIARLRKQEEEARQEKINRLMERKRVFAERQTLGQLCRVAGLNAIQKIINGDDQRQFEMHLDQELIAAILYDANDALFSCSSEKKEEMRATGRRLLDYYQAEQKGKGRRQ